MDSKEIDFDKILEEALNESEPRRRPSPRVLSVNDIKKRYRFYDEYWPSEKALSEKEDSLQAQSEKEYSKVAKQIVGASVNQLITQNRSKTLLKKIFTIFFVVFISVQYAALIALFAGRIFLPEMNLSDEIIIAYMSSIFVETLGGIVLMIKYAFDSSQETKVLDILNGVIGNYQKFHGEDPSSSDEEKKNTK